jgi:hypothetical protein
MNNHVTVNAVDYDEAIEELQEIIDEAIEALIEGEGEAICYYGIPRYFTHRGEEDYDWEQVGEFDFTLEDIGLDERDLFVILKECCKERDESNKELRNIKNKLREIVEKINKKEK